MDKQFYCKKIEIQGFKGFQEKQSLEFHEHMNILYGVNGSGKSSVLSALNLFIEELSQIYSSSADESNDLYRFTPADINNKSDSLSLKMELHSEKDSTWRAVYDSVKNKKIDNDHRLLKTEKKPVVVSYSVNRALNAEFSKDSSGGISKPEVYKNNINSNISFSDFVKWFNLTEAAVLQEQVEKIQLNKVIRGAQSKNAQSGIGNELDIVRAAINTFTGFSSIALDRKQDPIVLTARKGSQKISSIQMSDGEKCLLAMVGDISRRLIQLNSDMSNPLEGLGIVVIDEADLHLHPSWQRELIPGLTKTFPKIQFILTTHSPQILSQVMEGKVFNLKTTDEGNTINEIERTYGQDTNRILEELMDTSDRPSDVKESIKEIYELIDSLELEKAKESITVLKDKIGNDSDLDKATVILEIKEAQQK